MDMTETKQPTVTVAAKYIAMLAPFISNEATRYYLNGISFEPHADGVIMVATDGHRMGVILDKDGQCDAPVIYSIDKAILAACKKKSEVCACFAAPDPGLCRVIDAATGDTRAIGAAIAIDGTYPDWTRVIPRDAEDYRAAPFAFNPKYLADFKAVAKYGGSEFGIVEIHVTDEKGPAVIRVAAVPEFFGLLMPMRFGDTSQRIPDWLPDPQKAALDKAVSVAA